MLKLIIKSIDILLTRKAHSWNIIKMSLNKWKKFLIYLAKKYYMWDNNQRTKAALYKNFSYCYKHSCLKAFSQTF